MTIVEAKARLDVTAVAARLFPHWEPATSCKAPWREDNSASFSVYDNGQRWKDHGTGEVGDAADFVAKALDISPEDGLRQYMEMAGGGYREQSRPTASALGQKIVRTHQPADSDDKRHKRAMWPAMELPTNDELETIATLRRLPLDGPHWASMDGALRMANVEGQRCFIIRSTCGKNAQARRLDGQPLGENLKAKTLAGSIATLPVGNYHDRRWPAVAVVEGGPDVLAAYAAIYKLGLLDAVAVAGMLGAAMRPPYGALATMAGRRVRIFQHNDGAGQKAADSWARLIHNAGGDVDIWTPAQAGADLNDIFHLTESELSEALAEAFDFVKGGF